MSETLGQFIRLIRDNSSFAFVVVNSFILAMFFSLAVIFYKIKQKPWKALIPIYNYMVLIEILDIPIWMFLVIVIPFVNIIGIPFMIILVGWKLGAYCRKGLFMRLGLILCPPLFFPLLAASFIDLDGTGRYVMEPVKLPTNFSLDTIEVEDISNELYAMSLGNSEVIESIAPIMATRKVEIPTDTVVNKKDFKDVETMASANEVEDLNRVLPTADDLTFDYNSLYQSKELPKEEKVEIPVEEETKPDFELATSNASESTVDYNELYKNENSEVSEIQEEEKEATVEAEKVEDEPKIIIHEVSLEAAEPIDVAGPIPINKRYDYQSKKSEAKEIEVAAIHDIEYKEEAKEEKTSIPSVFEEPPVEEIKIEEVKENIESTDAEITNPVEVPKLELPTDTIPDVPEINPLVPPTISPISNGNENLPIPEVSVEPVVEINASISETGPVVSPPTGVEENIVQSISEASAQTSVEQMPEMIPSAVNAPEVPTPMVQEVINPVASQQTIVQEVAVPQAPISEVSNMQPVAEMGATLPISEAPAQTSVEQMPEMIPSVVNTPEVPTPMVQEVINPVVNQQPTVQEVAVPQAPIPEVSNMQPVAEMVVEVTPSIAEPVTPVVEMNVTQPTPNVVNAPETSTPAVQEVISQVVEQQSMAPQVAPVNENTANSVSVDLPMQAASPFGADGMPSLADIPDLALPNVNAVPEVEVPEINLTEQAMQGMRERKTIEPGTRVDQIVSMNIAEPDQLPVGILVKPQPPVSVPPITPAPMNQPVPQPPEMTRAEAMGIKQNFFTGVVPNGPVQGNNFIPPNNPPMNNGAPMMQPQPMNNMMPQQGMPGMMNNGIGQLSQQPMNYGQPTMNNRPFMPQQPVMNSAPMMQPQPVNNMMPQQGMPGMMNNGVNPANPTSIFQVNSANGGPLLRPVESNIAPAEKVCPVCGVKLKPDCPICIMCGFKF